MLKKLLCIAGLIPLMTYAQTDEWAVCEMIETTTKVEMGSGNQILFTVNTKNISGEMLPEQLCVYLSTEEENFFIEGGTCHEPFDADVTKLAAFSIKPKAPLTEFPAIQALNLDIKLKSSTSEDDYCDLNEEINLSALLSIDEIMLHEAPQRIEKYDLSGRLIRSDYKGLYLQKAFYSNGYVHIQKMYQQ